MKAITQKAEMTGRGGMALAHISQETEWCDETHLFTMGRPLDAPEFPPAGSTIKGQGFSLKSSLYTRAD